MKVFFLYILSLVAAHGLFARQVNPYAKDSTALGRTGVLVVAPSLSLSNKSTNALPFSKIVVKDVRFDTSLIGIYVYATFIKMSYTENKKINFENGLTAGFEQMLTDINRDKLSPGDHHLVLFVKKCMLRRKEKLTEKRSKNESKARFEFETEAFWESGGRYYPAFRIDTNFTGAVMTKEKEVAATISTNFLTPVFNTLQQKIVQVNASALQKKESYSGNSLDSIYYTRRFNMPVLSTSVYNKGIYRNFNEFKNNQPSITEFLVSFGRKGNSTFIDAFGNDINPLQIFGYCDGQQLWIQRGDYSYPLIRTGNGFEYFFQANNAVVILQSLDMENDRGF